MKIFRRLVDANGQAPVDDEVGKAPVEDYFLD